jgi:hypothetical protein
LLELWLIAADVSAWWSVIAVVAANGVLLAKDKRNLAQGNYETEPLDSFWMRYIAPVYLFKRVEVAGGGYGYPVLWMATFAIFLLSPFFQSSGGLSPISGSAGIEVYCEVGTVANNCSFTNTRDRSGAIMCVKVSVENQRRIRSETVCSGPVKGFDSVLKPVFFLGEQPAQLCLGPDFLGTWDDCTVAVIEQ